MNRSLERRGESYFDSYLVASSENSLAVRGEGMTFFLLEDGAVRLGIETATENGILEIFEITGDYAVKSTELFKQRFRHCATRSFMVLRRYRGREVSVARQQLRSEKFWGASLLPRMVRSVSFQRRPL